MNKEEGDKSIPEKTNEKSKENADLEEFEKYKNINDENIVEDSEDSFKNDFDNGGFAYSIEIQILIFFYIFQKSFFFF